MSFPADPKRPDIRYLNRPQPVEVRATHDTPREIQRQGEWRAVEEIIDVWRIDDEWWREPITRRYFTVRLAGDIILTVYHDLASGLWYAQWY